MSGHSVVSLAPVFFIGASTPVSAQVTNPHGVRAIRAHVEQNGTAYPLLEETSAATRFLWKRHEAPRTVTFEAGKQKAPELKEGKARVVVETISNDLRGSRDTAAADVTVVLAPPRVLA